MEPLVGLAGGMTRTDSELVQASLDDPAVFGELFDRHFAVMHGYLSRRVGRAAADDLAADVFTAAFAARRTYRPERDSALPWLYGIASNLVHAHLRADRRRSLLGIRAASRAQEHQLEFDDDVVASLDARREMRQLTPRLRALSANDLTTLLLYAWEDLSYEEVGEALGIPVGTVRSRLNRVRRRLREPVGDRATSQVVNHIDAREES